MLVIVKRFMLTTNGLKIGTVSPRRAYVGSSISRNYDRPDWKLRSHLIRIYLGDLALSYILTNIIVILLSVGGWGWKLALCPHVAIDRGTHRMKLVGRYNSSVDWSFITTESIHPTWLAWHGFDQYAAAVIMEINPLVELTSSGILIGYM
jgi:hypothetical protein